MRSIRLLLGLLALALCTAPLTAQRSHARGYTRSTPRSRSYSAPKTYRAPRQPSYSTRDSRGKIHRNREAKDEFLRRTGYPHGRPGYVVDHIVPLCAGGADASSNMQWQTVAEAKVKDRRERAQCARHTH